MSNRNRFQRMAQTSNTVGQKAITDYLDSEGIENYKISKAVDPYSTWDLRVDLPDQTILAETKHRDKSYDTLMVESNKAKNLTNTVTTWDDEPVSDHWYINTFKDRPDSVIFSFNDLREREMRKADKPLTFADTNYEGDYMLSGTMKAPKTTAGNSDKVYKEVFFVPEHLKIN